MQVSRLTPANAAEYRAVMLQAYADETEVFTSTVPEREPLPLDWWVARISDQPNAPALVLGAFVDARIAGVVGLRFERRARIRHKATLYGLYVLPELRGQGMARTLIEAVLSQARSTPDIRVVQLTVVESNESAVQLYESCGFVPFGTEPLAVRYGERFVSRVHMSCVVSR